jgi:3-methyl-2-oxobutanoate hydroxymethyltransferase
MKRKTILDILTISNERKLRMLTSYTANIARFTQHIADILLVGDSLGMVLYNMPSTHGVTLEMMINHAKAVVSSTTEPMIIVDMPFGSYESSPQKAFESASAIIAKTGACAVKIEGGTEMSETVEFLTKRGITVIGHIGLMPQKIHTIGSYKKINHSEKIIKDFAAIHNSGAFAIVLENISNEITNEITKHFPNAITIGIGAGTNCKGHVAVFEDLINLSTTNLPPFSQPIFDSKTHILPIIERYFEKL